MIARVLAALLVLSILTACGADGAPERPEPRPTPGITISGTAAFGIAGRS